MPTLVLPRKAHQDGDVAFLEAHSHALLANEPGLGKSRSAIDATKHAERVLIVAPRMILESGVWADEIERWGQEGDCEYHLAPYTLLNQRKGSKILNAVRPEWKGPWDAIIADEVHYVKGRNTYWTWALKEINKSADRFIGMTGTPIPNWAHEVFVLLQLLFPQEAGRGQRFGSFWRWAEEWFDTSPTRFSNGNPVVGELLGCKPPCYLRDSDDPCEHWIRFARGNFGSLWRRCLRKDCLDLPPLTEQTVNVPLDGPARRLYADLKKEFSAIYEGEEILAWSQGAKNVMMDQLTVSPWFLNPKGEPHGGKLDMLKFDLQGRAHPTFVVAHYRRVVEACARVAESTGARVGAVHGGFDTRTNGATVRAFKRGELDVLVGSIETVAEGLTLVQADMTIFVEKSFKPYRNEQAVMRIYRMGQQRPVTVRDYVTPNTVDRNKRKRIATKSDRAERMMTAAEFAALM